MTPQYSQAVVLRHIEGRKGEVYYPIEKVSLPIPPLQPHDLLIKVSAAALNHRDYFVRQDLYPNVRSMYRSAVTEVQWEGKRVTLNPGHGWANHPDAPESSDGYLTLGASPAGTGTLQEYMVVNENDVAATPEHLSDVEAAAIPAAGLTAWRALIVKSNNAVPGRNILITGIGGGVALFAAQFALAAGCNVFATSSSEEKLRRAKELGVRGGVLYTYDDWDARLLRLLPPERKLFDAIIDSAGGDIVTRGARLLRMGGTIVTVGMTLSPAINFPMKAVFRQIKLVSSGMGSRVDFADMMDCIRVNGIKPVVSRTIQGIEDLAAVDRVIGDIARGGQFGKVVIEVAKGLREIKL